MGYADERNWEKDGVVVWLVFPRKWFKQSGFSVRLISGYVWYGWVYETYPPEPSSSSSTAMEPSNQMSVRTKSTYPGFAHKYIHTHTHPTKTHQLSLHILRNTHTRTRWPSPSSPTSRTPYSSLPSSIIHLYNILIIKYILTHSCLK